MTRRRDTISFADTVIQEEHRMIHDGFMFHLSGKVTGMVDTNVDDYLIIVGDEEAHLDDIVIGAGRGDIDILMYEGTTVSANGSALTPFNQNRESANTPNSAVYTGPTVTGVGTLIHTAWLPPTGTGTGLSANGVAGPSNGEEWMLAPNTNYLIRITNNSGATIAYRYEFRWYELDYPTL